MRAAAVLIFATFAQSALAQQDPFDAANAEFATFRDAISIAGMEKIFASGDYAIVAPTDFAWSKLPEGSLAKLSSDPEALRRILGCHVIVDPQWETAVAAIVEEKTGTYTAETLGGCNITASWTGATVSVVDQYGDGSTLFASMSDKASYTDSLFLPPGTDVAGIVRSSRLFAGPSQFPPSDFAAYAMLAFTSLTGAVAAESRQRIICESFVRTVPHTKELFPLPLSEQMGTVWPVNSDDAAQSINKMPKDGVCDAALPVYDLVRARQALKDAEAAGADISGAGPYLIAWSPAAAKGAPDAIVLVLDLSRSANSEQADRYMLWWVNKIESDPNLWNGGFDIELARLHVEAFLNEFGQALFHLTGG